MNLTSPLGPYVFGMAFWGLVSLVGDNSVDVKIIVMFRGMQCYSGTSTNLDNGTNE